jgi:hypothetical protein
MSTFLGVFSEIEDQILADLKVVGDYMVQIYKQQAPVQTGRLRNSIKYAITKTPEGYRISIGYLIYGVFQDLGVKGTFGSYANARSSPFQFKKETIDSKSGLPFAVRRSIAEKGLRAMNWTQLDTTAEAQIQKRIEEIFGEGYEEVFGKIFARTKTEKTIA